MTARFMGNVLAFIDLGTWVASERELPSPAVTVTADQRGYLARIARQFLRARRAESAPQRFDVLAIESGFGIHPASRLHKAAFLSGAN